MIAPFLLKNREFTWETPLWFRRRLASEWNWRHERPVKYTMGVFHPKEQGLYPPLPLVIFSIKAIQRYSAHLVHMCLIIVILSFGTVKTGFFFGRVYHMRFMADVQCRARALSLYICSVLFRICMYYTLPNAHLRTRIQLCHSLSLLRSSHG